MGRERERETEMLLGGREEKEEIWVSGHWEKHVGYKSLLILTDADVDC